MTAIIGELIHNDTLGLTSDALTQLDKARYGRCDDVIRCCRRSLAAQSEQRVCLSRQPPCLRLLYVRVRIVTPTFAQVPYEKYEAERAVVGGGGPAESTVNRD